MTKHDYEENNTPIVVDNLKTLIYTIRGVQVMTDSDLAKLYGVETKRINEQVRRNAERFPERFCFQLTRNENDSLRSQNATLDSGRGEHKKYLPRVFTEQGVAMLSTVLKSKTAVIVSLRVMDAFVGMRRFIQNNAQVFQRLDSVERRQISFETNTKEKFEKVFDALEQTDTPPKQGIFYNGQVYDAHTFASKLVRSAKKSLVLIDNYIDDSVLTLFTKRSKGVSATIYTRKISKALALDLKKYNEQYPPVTVQEFKDAHDRFLIVDDTVIYHLGASMKDLGKKWFAFSKFEKEAMEMLGKLEGN